MNNINLQDTQFFEPDERFAQKLDFNTIVMRQIDKVRSAGSVEWMGGYWETKPYIMGVGGSESERYIPDTRQVYINSIDSLFDLLVPHFDETFQEKMDLFEKKYEEHVVNINKEFQEGKEKIEKDDKYPNDRINSLHKRTNQRHLEYKVEHKRRVFWELLRLIKRIGLIDNAGVREEA